MDYREALDWLYATQLFGVKLGLETSERLLVALDCQSTARVVHVAGTNGKGSVCAMAAAVCDAQGYRTGLFTSPHLVSFRERIRIDGHPIPEAAVAAGLARLREITLTWETTPTFFEFTTALALDWFRQMHAEVVVLETGMGGRLDATNAITPAVSVLTAIDFDHTAWLGDTLTAIAGEKAGIIKPGVPVVCAPQEPEAAEVIARAAAALGAPLHVVGAPLPDAYAVGLAGSHQRLNAALALAALDAAGIAADEKARHAGLARVDWPGRFQRLENGRIILDGAHNPAAARRLAHTWHEEYGDRHQATIILGIMRDKDVPAICRALEPLAARFLAVPVRSPRSLGADELCETLGRLAPGATAQAFPDLGAALTAARTSPEPILVTGSLFLAGEALALLTGSPAPETSWQ
jgi:dihydrofolate synthase/folylpolyglutamate synthase